MDNFIKIIYVIALICSIVSAFLKLVVCFIK